MKAKKAEPIIIMWNHEKNAFGDYYDEESIDDMAEDGLISPVEQGFMKGYINAL